MSCESLRFLHATNLYVDHPLRDIGSVNRSVTEMIRNVTNESFEQIISVAIEQQVDFVLIVGNSFDARDCSFQSKTILANGFRRLDESGIPVFVLPGENDPPEAWRLVTDFSENVTILLEPTDEAIAIQRHGKVIATVEVILPVEANSSSVNVSAETSLPQQEPPCPLPFAIGLSVNLETAKAPTAAHNVSENAVDDITENESSDQSRLLVLDYLAFGGDDSRRTVETPLGRGHHPGSAQGLGFHQSGPHGCTLVEVDSELSVVREFVPTATVRYECLEICLEEESLREELIGCLRQQLSLLRPNACEKVWLIEWTIRGFGPLFDSLYESSFQDGLIPSLSDDASPACEIFLSHSFRLIPSENPTPTVTTEIGLMTEYHEALYRGPRIDVARLTRCLETSSIAETEFSFRLRELISDLDHERIFAHQHRLGQQWFDTIDRENC